MKKFIKPDIVLINSNLEVDPPVAPIGLACLAGQIDRKKYFPHIIDLCLEDNPKKELIFQLSKLKPLMIGVSVRNIFSGVPLQPKNYLRTVKKIIREIKKLTTAPIILGGAGFSIYPEEILRATGVEYGIIGEGEIPFVQFIEYLEKKRSLADISSLIFLLNGKVHISKRIYDSVNKYKPPAFDLIDYKKYIKAGGYVAVQTKRGCRFNCRYCTYPYLEGKNYRTKGVKQVVEEIKYLIERYDAKYFFFVDSVFSFPTNYASGICQEIINQGVQIAWMAYVNPRGITKNFAELMKKSGCIGAELTTDSASEKMLVRLGKGFTGKEIQNSIEMLHKYRIPIAIHNIIGGPGESLETVKETLSFYKRFPYVNAIFFNFGVALFRHSMFWEKYGNESYSVNKLRNQIYISPEIKKNLKLVHKMCLDLSNCDVTDLGYYSVISKFLFHDLMRKLKIYPVWKYNHFKGKLTRFL